MAKESFRMRIWQLMEKKGITRFPKPVFHRIPNFVGAEKAAQKLRELPEYEAAQIVFCAPDSPQRPVREMILQDGKTLVMATPRLKHGFLVVAPQTTAGKERFASTIKGAFKFGTETTTFPKPGLIVTGSVAVDKDGNRLGKGCGYGDREVKMITERFGKVPVVTTIHDVQLVEYAPSMPHDEKVDIIVTPTKIIRTKHNKR
ncbi:MAG: 5-formyltetrahydrofolate cyclo-ligase [Candidatus Bathyarchaeota archaeon]|nr:5-formyltetrahydrofolate cyclo-ligase [Candidatus Bathyarchaeota archaeon]